ncbi:hypothetical protein D3C84_1144740 [compost metagenome]
MEYSSLRQSSALYDANDGLRPLDLCLCGQPRDAAAMVRRLFNCLLLVPLFLGTCVDRYVELEKYA